MEEKVWLVMLVYIPYKGTPYPDHEK